MREPLWAGIEPALAEPGSAADGDEGEVEIAHMLGMAPVAVDEIVRQSGASAGAVQMALIELELAGRLVRHAGGRVSLAQA